MEISNALSNFRLSNLLKGKNLIYLVIGIVSLVLIALIILIVWFVTKDNKFTGGNNNISITPTISETLVPTVITSVPVVESQNFLYLKMNGDTGYGNIVNFDIKTNKANEITNSYIFKTLYSFSPNNKYAFVKLLDNNQDKYAVYNFESKSYNIVTTDNVIQSYWADNNYFNYITSTNSNYDYKIYSLNVFDNTSSIIKTIPLDSIINPLISRDSKYMVGINKVDDSYHLIDIINKVDTSIMTMNLSSGSYFNPIEWTKENKLIFNSSNGLYLFNPFQLNSTQLASLNTKNSKLEIKFLNYNEDFKSILFMLDGRVHRYNINSDITKEVFNNNDRSDIKTISLKGNGFNYFLMENYNGKLEIYNISNSRLVTICDSGCSNPLWLY